MGIPFYCLFMLLSSTTPPSEYLSAQQLQLWQQVHHQGRALFSQFATHPLGPLIHHARLMVHLHPISARYRTAGSMDIDYTPPLDIQMMHTRLPDPTRFTHLPPRGHRLDHFAFLVREHIEALPFGALWHQQRRAQQHKERLMGLSFSCEGYPSATFPEIFAFQDQLQRQWQPLIDQIHRIVVLPEHNNPIDSTQNSPIYGHIERTSTSHHTRERPAQVMPVALDYFGMTLEGFLTRIYNCDKARLKAHVQALLLEHHIPQPVHTPKAPRAL